jgi:nickel/cobalt exporter
MAMASTAAAFAPPHAITTTTTSKINHFPQTYAHTNTRPNSIPSSSPFSIHTHTPLPRRHPRTSTSSNTRMNMMAPAASGASAVMGVISGGILGGALHAIAGPDHLAALLPKCCGQKWYRAGRIGALWGMGHGVSATILGLTAFGLKNRIASMPGVKGALIGASSVMEVAVGASLIFIGLLGIKEAREFGEEDDSSPSTADDVEVEKAQKRAVIFNGILHGFSWDGAPSLAPALAVATWRGSISFLLAYAVGTMGAMSITTTLIGESTRRAGKIFHKPDLPQKLSVISSFLAMAVGIFWCYIAFK